jgi:AmiR/NasT family two-component response regulator
MTQSPTVAQRALRVLIVEDETLVGMTLQHQLEQLGHSVVGQAADAAEATALFRKHSPDLVLLDIRLRGGGDGLELAALLREERACPVIVISAFSEPQLIDRAAEVGVFGYLVKPVNERALEAQIEVALKRFAERQALAGEVQQLQQALETRRLLDRAKAILIKRAGLSEDDAHRHLLQESQNRRVPLAKLCRGIIDADQAKRG